MPKTVDLTGKQFGRLTVLYVSHKKHGRNYWLCKCSCKEEALTVVDVCKLTGKHTKSCGCLQREKAAEAVSKLTATHRESKTILYKTWNNAVLRCADKEDPDYGGRGIRVFEPWLDNYEAFREYVNSELGKRPSGHQLDRVNNNGNYEPGNLRWSSRKIQCRNRRSNVFYEIDGQKKCLAEWAEIYNMPYTVVWKRMRHRAGWTIVEALTVPVRQMKKVARKNE